MITQQSCKVRRLGFLVSNPRTNPAERQKTVDQRLHRKDGSPASGEHFRKAAGIIPGDGFQPVFDDLRAGEDAGQRCSQLMAGVFQKTAQGIPFIAQGDNMFFQFFRHAVKAHRQPGGFIPAAHPDPGIQIASGQQVRLTLELADGPRYSATDEHPGESTRDHGSQRRYKQRESRIPHERIR
jgi:hypothetical protein